MPDSRTPEGIEILIVPETTGPNLFSIPPFVLITPCSLTFTCVLIIFVCNFVKLSVESKIMWT